MAEVKYIRIPQEIAPSQLTFLLDYVARLHRNERIYRRYCELRGSDFNTNLFMDIAVEFGMSDVNVRDIVKAIEANPREKKERKPSEVLNFAFSRE